jgi:hypothetical protein
MLPAAKDRPPRDRRRRNPRVGDLRDRTIVRALSRGSPTLQFRRRSSREEFLFFLGHEGDEKRAAFIIARPAAEAPTRR